MITHSTTLHVFVLLLLLLLLLLLCAQVCDKGTGHAEVVAVTFDPSVISFRDLLDVFFTIHDPTTPNRQGADVGPQYRSIILYTSEEQKRVAEEVGGWVFYGVAD
jgi:methionine-S-sulfoxide reductase